MMVFLRDIALVFFTVLVLSTCGLQVLEFGASQGTIRIVHFSDTHFDGDRHIYDRMMETIRSLEPDILLFTGDLVSSRAGVDVAESYWDDFPDSVLHRYAVIGNHEYAVGLGEEELELFYQRHGFDLLVNEGIELSIGDRTLHLYGFDDLLSGDPVAPTVEHLGDTNLILGHEPLLVDLLDQNVLPSEGTLFFSGHSHGGQITLFGLPLYLPMGSGDYVKGHYDVGPVDLFVSKGVGTTGVDVRLFARPDVIVFNLD